MCRWLLGSSTNNIHMLSNTDLSVGICIGNHLAFATYRRQHIMRLFEQHNLVRLACWTQDARRDVIPASKTKAQINKQTNKYCSQTTVVTMTYTRIRQSLYCKSCNCKPRNNQHNNVHACMHGSNESTHRLWVGSPQWA